MVLDPEPASVSSASSLVRMDARLREEDERDRVLMFGSEWLDDDGWTGSGVLAT